MGLLSFLKNAPGNLARNLYDIDAKYVDAVSLDETLEYLAQVRAAASTAR